MLPLPPSGATVTCPFAPDVVTGDVDAPALGVGASETAGGAADAAGSPGETTCDRITNTITIPAIASRASSAPSPTTTAGKADFFGAGRTLTIGPAVSAWTKGTV